MRLFQVVLISSLLSISLAQNIQIAAPTEGGIVVPGTPFDMEIDRPVRAYCLLFLFIARA